MKAVAIPNIAIIHIQNTAPGPPTPMAKATPVMFPVPTREAALIVKAWNGETPESPSLFSTIRRNISGKRRICTNFVPNEKYSPAANSKIIRIYVHKILFPLSTIFEIHSISCFLLS